MKQICRIISVFLAVTIITLIMPTASLNVDASTNTTIKRLGGANRIETAISIANEGWDSADTVIIANGYNFADALAGVPLAAILDAPILLSNADSLPASVLSKIRALGANKIILLGGSSALNNNVESSLKAAGFSVMRIYGQSRYETSIAIAKYMNSIAGDPSEVFVASGVNFADALSISPIAGTKGCPVIYAPNTDNIHSSADDYLLSTDCSRITVLGGTSAVHSQTEYILKRYCDNVIRISGPDRYQTAQAICEHFNSELTGNGIAFATGKNFPDALAGGVFAAKNKIPVVLVSNDMANTAASGVFNLRSPSISYVFGGQSAVSDQTVSKIISSNSTTTTTTSTSATTTSTNATTTSTQPTTTTTSAVLSPSIVLSQYNVVTSQSTKIYALIENPPLYKYTITFETHDSNIAYAQWGEFTNNGQELIIYANNPGTTTIDIYITEAPQYRSSVTVTVPNELNISIDNQLPAQFDTYSYNGSISVSTYVTSASYRASKLNSGNYNIYVQLTGTKTFDYEGPSGKHRAWIDCKLIDENGVVVLSSSLSSPNNVYIGDTFYLTGYIASSLPAGNYTLILSDGQ